MKKGLFLLGVLLLILFSSGQEIKEEAIAINIEVPVRVFDGDEFVDNLSIKDFEVYEDGVLQKIEAVYLIKKTTIEREESELKKEVAKRKFLPQPSKRQFYLVFEVIDYSRRLGEVIDYFFNKVFAPEDRLTVVTPMKTYRLKNELFANKPLEKVMSELKEKLKKDVITGNAEYKSIIREIVGGETRLDLYLRLKELMRLDEKKLMDFAEALKRVEGQKNVFLLYQKNAIPVTSAPLDNITAEDLLGSASRLDVTFDVDKVKHAYSDSSISAYFIYLTSTGDYLRDVEVDGPRDMILEDWSMNIFSAFNEVAKATGGLAESSANPAFSFEKAAEASEKYYLLYYTPKKYVADGKFKNIEVKVKDKNYKITHRAGYIAD
jgi:VWFA-related protein